MPRRKHRRMGKYEEVYCELNKSVEGVHTLYMALPEKGTVFSTSTGSGYKEPV